MKKKNPIKNEKGFTLIEIIAVIIIMGILAAVAVPKFFSMQDDARAAALNGGLSEAAARFNHAFARYILDEKKAPSDVATKLATAAYLGVGAADTGVDIGDFVVTWKKDPDKTDGLIIEIIDAPTLGGKDSDGFIAEKNAGHTVKKVAGVNWGSS